MNTEKIMAEVLSGCAVRAAIQTEKDKPGTVYVGRPSKWGTPFGRAPARIITPHGLWRDVPTWDPDDTTVCIAAVCDTQPGVDQKIILCTDGKASSVPGDTEHNLKAHALTLRWRCLTSGNEQEIEALLPLLSKSFRTAITIDETNVVELARAALRQRLLDKREEFIQGRHSISYERFLKEGKNSLPDDIFRSSSLQVEHISLRAYLIIAGFTSDGFPMLLETDDRASVKIREHYAVVGEGALLAQSALVHRAHVEAFGLNRTLYCVYEAKKMAERVLSVGHGETIIIMHRNLTQEIINQNGLQFLWRMWLDHGPKDLPVKVKRRQKSAMFDTIISVEKSRAASEEQSSC
jgi:hypothetical protein